MSHTGRPPRRVLAVGVAALLLVAGCSEEQDPGLAPGDGGPRQTSATLGQCPPGGPDATTPSAGCLDVEGRVQRP